MKGALYFFILLVSLPNIYSQKSNQIAGKIVESKTKAPVVFATIQIKNQNNGVITDEKGFFRIPQIYFDNKDTLLISSIGYSSKEVPLEELKSNTLNVILLKSKIERLDAVVVMAKKKKTVYLAPRLIVLNAIKRIKINNPKIPYSLIGYYRDYQQFNGSFFNLNEAIIEIYDSGFQFNQFTHPYNQSVIYEYTQNNQFPIDSTLSVAYDNSKNKYLADGIISPIGGNELSILGAHNPIRNYNTNTFSFINTFDQDFLENHVFNLVGLAYLDNTPLYEISFYAKEKATGLQHNASGSIFISRENFRIHKLLYNGYRNSEFEPIYSLNVEYLEQQNKMYLNYISFSNLFRVKDSKNSFVINDISFDQQENALYVEFNNKINKQSTLNLKNYKLILNKRKLNVEKVILHNTHTLKLFLVNGTIRDEEISTISISKMKVKIKNIVDISGRNLGKTSIRDVRQFREYFVQEVFRNKPLNKEQYYVNKMAPLKTSKINILIKKNKYWVNTPLLKN